MPMDSLGYHDLNDEIFYKRAHWELKFFWFPKRCDFSKNLIWLEFAYQGVAMYTGPEDPIFEYRSLTKEEFLINRLKGKV